MSKEYRHYIINVLANTSQIELSNVVLPNEIHRNAVEFANFMFFNVSESWIKAMLEEFNRLNKPVNMGDKEIQRQYAEYKQYKD